MEGARKRWQSGRGFRMSPKTKILRARVRGFFRLLKSWCLRRRERAKEDRLHYTSLRRSNSFYADAIADCIDFIKRSSN